MSGFDNDTVYANNADFSRAGAGGGSAANGLQLDGQLWIGGTLVNAGGTHVNVGKLTSTGGSLTITNGTGTINLEVAGGGTVTETLTGNSGGAVSPLAANINTVGTGSITIAGNAGTHTLTTQLTGLNAHSVLVGAGTATITNVGPSATAGQVLQSAGGAADPVFSTATYPSTTTLNQILYSSSNNVVGQISAGNNGVLISGTTGIPSWLADGTTGQVLTATTNMPPTWVNPASSGTVTSVSVATANGFAGTVTNPTTTPQITISTTQTGVLTGNGTSITGTAITQYNVLTAGASNFPNSVPPSATVGVPLISQGSTAQPAFGTAVVAGGGTGDVSFVPYTPIVGGVTSTSPLQSVVSNATAGYVLTSNGASAIPTFQPASGGGAGSWQFIQTQSATGASAVIFNTSISSFTEIMIQYIGVAFAPLLEFSANNGSTDISGVFAVNIANNGNPPLANGATTSTYQLVSIQPSAAYTGWTDIQNFPGVSTKQYDGMLGQNAGGNAFTHYGIVNSSSQINWIRITPTGAGLFVSGTINVYGR